MPLLDQLFAILADLRREDIEALPPAHRRRLADLCRHVAKLCDAAETPKGGILAQLRRGWRGE